MTSGTRVTSSALPSPNTRAAVTLHGVEFRGFDRFVQAFNRRLGNVVFSVPAALVFAVVALSGLGLFVDQSWQDARLTVSAASPVLAVVALRVLGLAAVGPHETGHALVMARNRRHVGMVGIGFYWGALTFYVDASQALFLPRRTRMLQSSAGILTDLVVCGRASIVAMTGGDATWAVVLREFAVFGYLNIIINAMPLLELDGYWFLADALDRPTLQRDARRALVATLRRQPASRGLAAYAASKPRLRGRPHRPRVRGMVGPLRRAVPHPVARRRWLQGPGGLPPPALRADRHPPVRSARALPPKSRALI